MNTTILNKWLVLSCCALILVASCKSKDKMVQKAEEVVNPLAKYEKVEGLLKQMTLDEKIGQLNLYNGFYDLTGPAPSAGDAADKYKNLESGYVGGMLNVRGVKDVRKMQEIVVNKTRLGIPLIFGFDVIHGYKIQAPIPLAEAASWDLEAIKSSAALAAKEATAAGLNWTFAPNVDISRDARWGRVMEGAGEDPYLGSLIARARVRGFQGDDLSDNSTLAACAKHFAGYGFAESGRDYNTVDVSGSTLHNIILPPFRATVDAGVATFMNAFNELNGIPANADPYLQRTLLKGDWGFEGFVVSDWGSIGEIETHGRAGSQKEAAEIAIKAGSDMDMESYAYIKYLKQCVLEGKVARSTIEDAARRIMNIKYELGLFDDPYKYCDEKREAKIVNSPENRATVRDMAKKSIVLLKNDSDILPLKANQKVAVIGPLADDNNSPLGSWRLASDDNSAVTVKEGLTQHKNIDWSFYKGVDLIKGNAAFVFETKINETNRDGMEEAVEGAKDADVVVMVLGEHGFQSGEGRSRTKLDLPGLQQELLEKVYAVNKNIVLVVMSGRPLALTWSDENVPAILQTWQLGTETGNAIADVVMGDYNPSGKLPMSFPRSVGQVPIYYNKKNTGRPAILPNPDLVFWSHYSDESNDPLYAFGHGESYTTFEYSGIQASLAPDNSIKVMVTVKNTGDLKGEEVTQLYIRDKAASLTRPLKELKGFKKTMLDAGESAQLEFLLTDKELGFYDNLGVYQVEAGDFDIMVGGNSIDLLKTQIYRPNLLKQ